jgi:hypothetical protein
VKIDNLGDALRFATYSSRMINDPAGIAEELRLSAREKGIKFDTIVGRGSSGMLIVPLVARILRKKWFIVRKDEEVRSSHDSSCKWMGELGKRWIFLDDFCSSGSTFRKVRDGVREAVKEATSSYETFGPPQDDPNGRLEWRTYTRPQFSTELVGYFQYESRDEGCRELIPWNADARPGYSDSYLSDAPWMIEANAELERQEAANEAAKGVRLQAEADQRREAEIDLAVEYTPADRGGNPNCGVGLPGCNCLAPPTEQVEIRTWGDVTPVTSRYALQMAAYTNPQNNMIVRNI